VSVVDLNARAVTRTVPVGRRPYGVVVDPSGAVIYVAEQGADRIRALDAGTMATREVFSTPDRPSGMAVSHDGKTLYITHLLLNFISVLHFESPGVKAKSTRRDANHSLGAIALWPDSNLAQSIVLSPDGLKAYIPHTRSNTANRALTFDTTVFPIVSVIDLATGAHLTGGHISLETIDPPGVGLPFDAAISPDGGSVWVVNAASNDVTVVDAATRLRLAHVEVGDNPRGIVFNPDGTRVYVNNTLAGTVSVIDAATYTVLRTVAVTEIPLPPLLLTGKRLFHTSHDPRMSQAQWISCNTCHFEGEHDGRTWFFGFAGPRNTTSLLGMIQTYPLRWSGEWDESADGEFATRRENFGSGLISGEMNCTLFPPDCVSPHPPNQGRSDDLDALAAFMDSLEIPLSPAHAAGQPLSEAEARGKALFDSAALDCAQCHPAPLYTDHRMHDVGTTTADEKIGPEYDTPSLRGLYDSAPYFHDGGAATLYDALTYPTTGSEHDVRGRLSEELIQDLIAFLMALPYEN
ncbi:MAG: c-type cytochrome, partial [Desulfobacterales bacterium]|nr:c-type cytochrome [Desulfobacterales bacterium]